MRSGEIEILWNGAPLEFKEPPILEEELPNGQKVIWKKRIKIEVPWESHHQLLQVEGWIGIRIPASQRDAGFVLLRRGRVIIGGPEKGYRPVEIFGQPNSFSYQRLIGELNLDNWPVSQAKDTFDWSGGLEDKFIEILKEEINVKEIIFDSAAEETVQLDTKITNELREEGIVRELIRTIQGLRQDAGFRMGDEVVLYLYIDDGLKLIINRNIDKLKTDVSARTINFARTEKFDIELETKLDEYKVWIGIKRER